ncbi:MAG: class II fructose-bisphosphatase [Anaerolineae bacterium]|jgi:fructose-1,6-bisphosphatase II|nr:class II fructose-bisphosphatase [Anaerolineae bacterium]
MNEHPPRNLALDLVRVTEAAALAAGRWMGLGELDKANEEAGFAMWQALNSLDMDGRIVVGEEGRLGIHSNLDSGQPVGSGHGPAMDVLVDPIDGRDLLARGHPDVISVAAVAPRGSVWAPASAIYMDKLIVNREVADALVPECLEAPAAWTLALIARAKGKSVRDLVVFVLSRPRHEDLIREIRTAGARTMLRTDGEVIGALMAASPRGSVDVMMGIGGVSEAILAACATKALAGGMLARLTPQSAAELEAVQASGLDLRRVLTCDEIITSNDIFFAATGITNGSLLAGVHYHGQEAETQSLVVRAESRTRRFIRSEYWFAE